MAKVLVTESYLTSVGSAIRAKNRTNRTYLPSEMASAIEELKTEADLFISSKTFSENGSYSPLSFGLNYFSDIVVSVSGSGTGTSDATLSSGGQMLSGVTAYARGSKYTGTIPTYSGAVNSGAGNIPYYSGSYVVTPLNVSQAFSTSGKFLSSNFVVQAYSGSGGQIPYYSGSYVVTPLSTQQVFSTSGKAMSSNFIVEPYSSSGGASAVLSSITIRGNGTYTASSFGVDGFDSVVIDLSGIPPDDGTFIIYSGSGDIYASMVANSSVRFYSFPNDIAIKSYAFSQCPNLETVYMDGHMVPWQLSVEGFKSCPSLKEIFFMFSSVFERADTKAVGLFTNTRFLESAYSSNYGNIFVPTSLYADYVSNSYWRYMYPRLVPYPTDFVGPHIIPESAYYYFREDAPESIYAPTATMISDDAFYNCSNIKHIRLDNCSFIKEEAFRNCDIREAFLPSCVSLQESVFEGNHNLSQVSLPICQYISKFVFAECDVLSELYLPSCKSIGTQRSMTNLARVSLPVCEYIGGFVSCRLLSSVHAPICKSVGENAFRSDSSLTEISFPLCETLGGLTFCDCSSISSVYIPKCKTVMHGDFINCTLLQNISFPECTYIGTEAFRNCINLREAYLPNVSILSGRDHFRNCENLSRVILTSCTQLDSGTFMDCSKLEYVDIPNVSEIPKWTFYNTGASSTLTTVNIYNCLSISKEAFEDCHTLQSISASKCKYIKEGGFYSCSSLSIVSMPKLSEVEARAFYDAGLQYIDFPLLSYAAKYAFVGTSASYISLPELRNVQPFCFAFNYELISVYLPMVATFYSCAFRRCSKMTTLSINGLGYVSEEAFDECRSLSSIYVNYITSSFEPSIFLSDTPFSLNDSAYAKIYVPASKCEEYKAIENFSYFSNCIVPMEEV